MCDWTGHTISFSFHLLITYDNVHNFDIINQIIQFFGSLLFKLGETYIKTLILKPLKRLLNLSIKLISFILSFFYFTPLSLIYDGHFEFQSI